MSNTRSNLITVGRITGVFGIKGWVKVKSHTRPDTGILSYQPWCLKTAHGVKSVVVAEQQVNAKGLMVRFEGVEDRTAAEAYIRCDVAVDKSVLPSLEQDDFYWHQLIGLTVVDVGRGEKTVLGVVDNLMETGANDVLSVKASEVSIDQRERLIPYVFGVYVLKVDLSEAVIQVDWDPEF